MHIKRLFAEGVSCAEKCFKGTGWYLSLKKKKKNKPQQQLKKHKAPKSGLLGLVQCRCPSLGCGIEETAYEHFSLLSWQDCAGAGCLSPSPSVRSLSDVTTETGGGYRDRRDARCELNLS